jgi:hypothetical protein
MRNLTLAIAIFAAFAMLGMRYVKNTPDAGTPEIVAVVDLLNQNSSIPLTTLYSVPEDGLYRISAYLAETRKGQGNGYWSLTFGWNDEAGLEKSLPIQVQVGTTPPQSFACIYPWSCQQSISVKAKGGTDIQYAVKGAQELSGVYELHIVLEKME